MIFAVDKRNPVVYKNNGKRLHEIVSMPSEFGFLGGGKRLQSAQAGNSCRESGLSGKRLLGNMSNSSKLIRRKQWQEEKAITHLK